MATCLPYSERKCRRCIYGDKYELDKPCIMYSEECKLFRPKEQLIEPEDLTGTLGRLLDEVDMPADIQQEVENLYKRAVKEVTV